MTNICNCGTCKDAIETATKLVNQMLDNDCAMWAIQVCTAFSYAGSMIATGGTDQLDANSTTVREFERNVRLVMAPDIALNHKLFEEIREKVRAMRVEPDAEQAVAYET